MNRMIFFIFIFTITSYFTHAQSGLTIFYKCIYNLDGTIEKTAQLTTIASKALFKFIDKNDQKIFSGAESEDQFGNKSLAMNISLTDSLGTQFFTDLNEDVIISREILFQDGKTKSYIIKEPIEKINWEIKQGRKQIGRYYCQQALGKFRGRNYSVWFIPDIPIGIGPWKLHGLPGLIAEVVDDKNAVYFQIQSIAPIIINSDKISPPTDGQEVSFKEFFEKSQNISKDISKFIQAKLPRGTKFEVTNVIQNNIELSIDSK